MSGADADMGEIDAGAVGISRRDLITKSVVAGGLVWAAPVLFSTPAVGQTGCVCENGVETTIKVPSAPSANCGVQCLSSRADFNFPCLDDLANCLFELGLIQFETLEFQHGQVRKARIVLRGGITLLAASIKSDNECYFSECPNFCPNTCQQQNGKACTGSNVVPPDRIIVCPGGLSGGTCPPAFAAPSTTACGGANPPVGPNDTEILFDVFGDPINAIELALCIPNALTGQCPD
jgi:hypothetical protein